MEKLKNGRVEKGYVATRRGDIHFRRCGEDGDVVVFLHAVSTGGYGFQGVLPLMAAQGFRAFAIDLMGYGRSDKRDSGPWKIEDFVDNLEETLALLGVGQHNLVAGHFSGIVALEFATQNATRVGKLVIDGVPVIAQDRRLSFRNGQLPQKAVEWNIDGRHALSYWQTCFNLMSKVDPSLVLDADPSNDIRENYIALLETFAFEPNTMEAVAYYDIESRCRAVHQPTLIISSDHDWNRPHVDILAENIPNNLVHIFHGVHPLHQLLRPERAVEYAALVTAFFGKTKAQPMRFELRST